MGLSLSNMHSSTVTKHLYYSCMNYFSERKTDDGGAFRIRPEIIDDVRVEDLVNEFLNSQENVRGN